MRPGRSGRVSTSSGGMPEESLQTAIVMLAKLTGWLVYHTFDSRRCTPGFPDLVMAKGGRILFVELKAEKGVTQPAQQEWLRVLGMNTGVEVHVWRPAQWDDGTVESVLRGTQRR